MSAFDDAWAAFEEEAGPVLVSALSEHAPVVTGELAGSMTYGDDNGVLSVGSADPSGPIAAYVTRGTRPHGIDPVNGEFLHWINGEGADVFARHVDHPGTAPNPFHIDAWEQSKDEVFGLFRERLGHGVALAYLNPWRNRVI